MAKGNWKPSVINPCTRCIICGGKIKLNATDFVRLDGIRPAHKECAERKNKSYTAGHEIHKQG